MPRADRILVTIIVLAASVLCVALVPVHHDLWRSYITTSDADIIFVFEELLLNDRLPQWQFDHPGYLYHVLLALWSHLLKAVGWLDVLSYSEIVGLSPEAFAAAYGRLVFAGRMLSIALAALYVAVMFLAVRTLSRDTFVAGVSALIFAFGIGISTQSLILRTELPASLLVFLAFLATVGAANSSEVRGALLLAVSGFCAVLAMATKVQSIFLVLGLPVLGVIFGSLSPAQGWASEGDRRRASFVFGLAAVALSIPATVVIVRAIQLKGGSGLYQAATALFVLVAMLVYGALFGVPRRRVINGIAAVAVGVSCGFYFLFVHHSAGNVLAIVNYIEHALPHSRPVAQGEGTSLASLLIPIGEGALAVIRERTTGLNPFHEPFRVIEWFVAIGALAAAWLGRWRLALQAVALMGLSLAFEAVSNLRWFRSDYRIYTDPWTILAAGLMAAALLREFAARLFVLRMATAAAVMLIVGTTLLRAWDPAFVPRQRPDNACYQAAHFAPPIANHFRRYCS